MTEWTESIRGQRGHVTFDSLITHSRKTPTFIRKHDTMFINTNIDYRYLLRRSASA